MPTPLDTSSVARVAAILSILARAHETGREELSVTELAQGIGREPSQVSRMLKRLAATGLVQQDHATREYRLGWRLCVIASAAGDRSLLHATRPILQAIVARTNESALLSVQEGSHSLTISRVSSHHQLQVCGWIGRTSPLHLCASGRALLFDTSTFDIIDLIQGHLQPDGHGPAALNDMPDIIKRIAVERARGYTVAIDELEIGLAAVGAPIYSTSGHVIASITVSGPTARLAGHTGDLGSIVAQACLRATETLRQRPTSISASSSDTPRLIGRGRAAGTAHAQ